MKKINYSRQDSCKIRHKRITDKLKEVGSKLPRLVITKSNSHIIAQLFDDAKGITIASSSSLQLDLPNGNITNAKKIGADIAAKAIKLNVKKITFDRGGNKYHGKIKALADAARENGLVF